MNRKIKKLMPTVKAINALREKMIALTDEELRLKAIDLKQRRQTESGDKLLVEAFALVKEASRRAINKEHYDVQLLSGIVLYNGKISEAKTGEGKTITIYLPAFLASLEGNGVHIVTVNDYLANRDATEAKKVFDLLGVSVGCVLHNSELEDRKIAYGCDITYVTNSELGFDYLKDNLAHSPDQVVLRGFHYAIIDEVDSILIDEAKTPLIISGPGPLSVDVLSAVDQFVKNLNEGILVEASTVNKMLGAENMESGEFIKDEKNNQIYLTEAGIAAVESAFALQSYGDVDSLMLQRSVNNALRANYLMQKDRDYIVRNDAIEIVDSFTGRVLSGRRFSDGLHQAIEAKEKVTIQKENVTIATITFQSFFNKYTKKAGLTGTAMTSSKEFSEIYKLDVVEIPTNKPVIRQDLPDLVFRTQQEKWAAVVAETIATHAIGQPILIGTASIQDSETVSNLLEEHNIPHCVLNAKNEELEAGIIAEAGKYKAVTVATNMAGRGTDILLDDKAREVGGLKVIGTERHDSRRIDNQLKGRSGRQGDPGVSQFFISLEDKLMRVFGEQSSLDMLMMLAVEPGQPLQYKPLVKMIEKAQQTVENENRLTRENMMKYDNANNEHREQIYQQRAMILNTMKPRDLIYDMFNDVSDEIIMRHIAPGQSNETWHIAAILEEYYRKVAFISVDIDVSGMQREDLMKAFHQINAMMIDMKEKQIGDLAMALTVEHNVMLRFMDRNWATFLSSMEYIKQNIGGQAYGQKDPALEYKKRGVELFNIMIDKIKEDTVGNFMRCQVSITPPATQQAE